MTCTKGQYKICFDSAARDHWAPMAPLEPYPQMMFRSAHEGRRQRGSIAD